MVNTVENGIDTDFLPLSFLGGNAGDGSCGGHVGRGGEVKVVVREEDMDILAAIGLPCVQGGRGGKSGTHGKPGLGGKGGAGGDSFSWYTNPSFSALIEGRRLCVNNLITKPLVSLLRAQIQQV